MSSLVIYKIKREDENTIAILAYSPDSTIDITEVEYAIQKDGEAKTPYQVEKRFDVDSYGYYTAFARKDNTESKLRFQLYGLVKPCYNQSFTGSYSLDLGMWTAFHDYLPADYMFNFGKMYKITSMGAIFKANQNKRGEFLGILYPSFLDYVLPNTDDEKRFNHLKIQMDSFTEGGIADFKNTITHIRAWTYTQSTGRIKLVSDNIFRNNSSKNSNKVNFNELNNVYEDHSKLTYSFFEDFKDIEANKIIENSLITKKPLVSPFLIVRVEYDNKQNKKIIINEITAEIAEKY